MAIGAPKIQILVKIVFSLSRGDIIPTEAKCGMMMGPLHYIISNLVLIGGAGGYKMPQSYKVGKILDILAVFRLSRVII